jgi:hypothetical protein
MVSSTREERLHRRKRETGTWLAAAVRKVGNGADAVKKFFKDKRKTAANKAKAFAKGTGRKATKKKRKGA